MYGVGDGYRQAVRCFDIIRDALAAQGAELGHVVRTRMFVTDIERWEEFGRAHQEVFGEHRSLPTSSDGRNSVGRIRRCSASTLLRPRWSK